MRHVSLLWTDLKHFKSFTSAHIGMRRDPGLRMIFGENRQEPRLGANGCLSGSMLIDCPRDIGKYPRGIPLRSLLGKQFYTYSWNEEQHAPVLSWVSKVWKTGYRPVYRVLLTPYPQAQRKLGNRSGGITENQYLPPCELVGTYDHPVLLCDGSWKKLGELIPGDSLKSLYRSSGDGRGKLRWSGQEPTTIISLGRRNLRQPMAYYALSDGVSEYQFVCEMMNGPRPLGTHAHHIDENPLNHSPDNLEWKDAFKHISEHTSQRNRDGKAGWKVSGIHPRGMLGKTHTPEVIARIAEASARRKRSPEELQKLAIARARRVFDENTRQRMSEGQFQSPREACVYCGTITNLGNLSRWHNDNCSQKPQQINHRVDFLPELVGKEWVYDMSVENTHNFVANGVFVHNSGKSTIWDGVSFCTNGRSVRGKRAADLVTTGKKTTEVSTGWMIDGYEHVIKRSGPPERVYLDGKLTDQAEIDALLGLSRDRFLSSVLFGQAKPLFIDLPVPERGDLLDQVLGLGFWMRAADLAASKWSAAGVQLQRLQHDISRLEGAIAELPSDDGLRQLAASHDAQVARQVEEQEVLRPALNAEYRRLRRAELSLVSTAEKEDTVKSHLRDLNISAADDEKRIAVLDSEISRLSDSIAFFDEENGTCPTCGQGISLEFVNKHVYELRADAENRLASIDEIQEHLDSTIAEIDVARDELHVLSVISSDRHRLVLAASSKKSEISIVDNRIQVLRSQVNPYHEQIQRAEGRRRELSAQLDAKRAEETALSLGIDQLDFWKQGFRRVRIFYLTRVLSELEVETMSAARSLGLVGWHIGFKGETETKSGTVRLGIQAIVQSPEAKRDFDSWSPGEGQRVRCASALGLASLIQRHSGVVYDLEVWDEPSAWLSAEGIDDLFECLRERAYSRGKSIWIVDPRAGLSHGGFDEVWNVVKDSDGSHIDVARDN